MLKKFSLVSLIVMVTFSGCGKKQKSEIPLPISESEFNEAIEYGIKNSELSATEFVSDWTVDLGYGEGKGKATLVTPFLKTALLAKQAHMQGQKVNRELIKKALMEDADCITFEVLLFGGYPQFGRSAEFVLKCGDKEIKPVYQFVPPFAEMGRDYTQSVKGKVKFKKAEIPENSRVVLKVQFNVSDEPNTKDKYICEFEFDLSKYR